MEMLWIIISSLVAGWIVNWVANTLPFGYSFWANWASPLAHFTSAEKLPTANPNGERITAHPIRHLAVWLVGVGLGWLAYIRLGWQLESLVLAIEAWCFLAIAVIDLEHRRVLNRMLLPMVPLIAAVNFWTGTPSLPSALAGALVGFGLFLLLALVKPGSMGMGDVKLAGIIGFAVGLHGTVLALLISVYSAGLAALLILLYHRFRRGQTMAYAPYLVLGAWVALYFGAEIWPFYLI